MHVLLWLYWARFEVDAAEVSVDEVFIVEQFVVEGVGVAFAFSSFTLVTYEFLCVASIIIRPIEELKLVFKLA